MTEENNGAEAAPTPEPPAPPPPPPQIELLPCPCGEVPSGLLIEMGQRAKYGQCMGDCCAEWSVEFRNGYSQDQHETLGRAQEAWNSARRANPSPSEE